MGQTDVTVTSPTTLWCWLPVGKNTINLDRDCITVSSVSCCCCCRDRQFQLQEIETVEARRSCIGPPELLLVLLISLFSGFLWHCIPAAFIGAADSLGSSGTHKLLGGVWGAFALITIVLFAFVLRPAQVIVTLGDGGCCSTVLYEAFSMPHAVAVADACRMQLKNPEESEPHPALTGASNTRRYIDVTTGLGVLLLLVINAVLLFGVFVRKCSDCGGCSDDGQPRDGCYYSAVGGEPEALVCGILLCGMIALFVRRFYVVCQGEPVIVQDVVRTIEYQHQQQDDKSVSQLQ